MPSRSRDELRWSAGVPVGTNPLILLDFFTIMAVVFLLAWLILLAAQFYFDGFVQMQHVRGAAVVALDLCLLCAVFTSSSPSSRCATATPPSTVSTPAARTATT